MDVECLVSAGIVLMLAVVAVRVAVAPLILGAAEQIIELANGVLGLLRRGNRCS